MLFAAGEAAVDAHRDLGWSQAFTQPQSAASLYHAYDSCKREPLGDG